MSEKIVIELTPEEYSMLMTVLNQIAKFKGTASGCYAERLIVAIEKKSKVTSVGGGESGYSGDKC